MFHTNDFVGIIYFFIFAHIFLAVLFNFYLFIFFKYNKVSVLVKNMQKE